MTSENSYSFYNSNVLRWRCGVMIAAWLLASAASVEMYEDIPDGTDVEDQDDNDLDSFRPREQADYRARNPDLALAKDVLLYKLIQALKIGETQPKTRFRPHWPRDYQEPRPRQDSSEKDSVVKRLTDVMQTNRTGRGFKSLESLYRPQQKWKIKKGSQMVCYFKLCAFRSPI